jgi:hypothetical protein
LAFLNYTKGFGLSTLLVEFEKDNQNKAIKAHAENRSDECRQVMGFSLEKLSPIESEEKADQHGPCL